MAIPDFQSIFLPLLELTGDQKVHRMSEAIDSLAGKFQLTEDEKKELLPSGRQARFTNRVAWASAHLKSRLPFGECGKRRVPNNRSGFGGLKNKTCQLSTLFYKYDNVLLY